MKSKSFSLGIFSLVIVFHRVREFEFSVLASIKEIKVDGGLFIPAKIVYLTGFMIMFLYWGISVSITVTRIMKQQKVDTELVSDGGNIQLRLSDFPPEMQELAKEHKHE